MNGFFCWFVEMKEMHIYLLNIGFKEK